MAPSTHSAKPRDHGVFDAEISYKAPTLAEFGRLLTWAVPHRRQVLRSLGLVLLASFLAILLPVIISRVIIDGILIQNPMLHMPDLGMNDLTTWIAHQLNISVLVAALLLYGVLTLCCHGAYHLHRVTLSEAVMYALRDLRLALFTHIERLPSTFFDKVAVGRVMTRVTNDIQALFDMLIGIGMLIGEFVPFFIALGLMLAIDVELTAYLLIAIPVFGVMTYFFRLATRQIYRQIRSSVSQLNQNLQENLSGIQVVQLSNREQRNLDAYQAINVRNQRQEISAVTMETSYGAFMDNMVNMALAAILWIGGGEVIQAQISLGSLILFTQFIDMFIRPIRVLGQQYNVIFRAMASAERIFQALDWDEKLREPAAPKTLPKRLKGEVVFNRLTFGYEPGQPVIKDFSLTIAPGEKVAIVGPTGSGKSTLIRLLSRSYDFHDNAIFIDGIDLNDLPSAALRQRIGVVLQDFHIFAGTVLDNIRLGDPNISIDDAKQAAAWVNADEFINALPQGFDTFLNERGQNLSQGERQLLAFARVLARDPEILILDEATASIDTETEQTIQTALGRLTRGRTSILIAHRLQTIQEADRIVVLKHGELREVGSHETLMAARGIYHTLTQLQFQDLASLT
ncbi:MAG: ABC transporter ATP-binding protein [Proteobacteria bacterium]|nr:ABC transporter ATP-binding protein [Pseudomonadota bacterium]MDA1206998.1 ABC transporter ATP-binding protein [Pseudomonadota bacterium]